MDHPLAVGGGEAVEEPIAEAPHLVGGERSVGGDALGEVAAGQVVHDEHEVVAVVEHVEQLDDGRVVEAPQDLGLAPDPQARLLELLGRAVQRQALQRHLAAVGRPRQVDHAHAAPAQSTDGLVRHEEPG